MCASVTTGMFPSLNPANYHYGENMSALRGDLYLQGTRRYAQLSMRFGAAVGKDTRPVAGTLRRPLPLRPLSK